MQMCLDNDGVLDVAVVSEFCNCKGQVSGGLREILFNVVTRWKT